jgi:hypothetical protein
MKALRFYGSKDGVPEEFYGHVVDVIRDRSKKEIKFGESFTD